MLSTLPTNNRYTMLNVSISSYLLPGEGLTVGWKAKTKVVLDTSLSQEGLFTCSPKYS